MLRWLFLCYQSHALLVIHMLPLCHAPLLIQIDATTMSCSLGHLQLPMFHVTSLSIHMLHQWVFICYINEYSHVTLSIHMLSLSYASLVIPMLPESCFICHSHGTSDIIHWLFRCNNYVMLIHMLQICNPYWCLTCVVIVIIWFKNN